MISATWPRTESAETVTQNKPLPPEVIVVGYFVSVTEVTDKDSGPIAVTILNPVVQKLWELVYGGHLETQRVS